MLKYAASAWMATLTLPSSASRFGINQDDTLLSLVELVFTLSKIFMLQGQAKRMQIIMLIGYHQIFWRRSSHRASLCTW